jgi:hypothetical protein
LQPAAIVTAGLASIGYTMFMGHSVHTTLQGQTARDLKKAAKKGIRRDGSPFCRLKKRLSSYV